MIDRESQITEFKPNWQDDYLKIICAFANMAGGTLIIGVDDKGNPVGVKNAKKLLEDLPNKIINKLGITPWITTARKDKKDIIHIKVSPSSVPISYDGRYYVRSGSTTQKLKASELMDFLLKKTGKTWDDISIEASFSDIDVSVVEDFKNLAKNRIPAVSKMDSIKKIFRNLDLIAEDKNLTNAGILLFGKEPQRFFISAKTRVGRFKTSVDIIDTVIITGNLFRQVEVTVEAIKKHLSVRFEINRGNKRSSS